MRNTQHGKGNERVTYIEYVLRVLVFNEGHGTYCETLVGITLSVGLQRDVLIQTVGFVMQS